MRRPRLALSPRPASWWSLAIAALLAIAGANLRLGHTDLWGHIAYGRWIWQHGLPATEPLTPACRGVPMPPVDWLWKLGAYALRCLPGGSWNLLLLQAVPLAMLGGAWSRRTLRTSRSVVATLAGLVAMLALLEQQLLVRPQLMGLAFFAVVWQHARGRPSWWGLALLFALWANVHGSWPLGLVVLAAESCGEVVRCRSFRSRRLRSLAIASVAAAAAVCLNPDGPLIYRHVLGIAANEGVYDLIEWQPLAHTRHQLVVTQVVAATLAVLTLLAWRWPRPADVLLLAVFAWQTIGTSRWIVWLAPIAGELAAVQLAHIAVRWLPALRRLHPPRPLSLVVALVALLALPLLWPREAVVDAATPIEACRVLRERDVRGTILATQEFGDTLLWFGPPRARPLLHSHVHLVRPEVWQRYVAAMRRPGGDALPQLLDEFDCTAAVLMRGRHERVAAALLTREDWHVGAVDDVAIVLLRATAAATNDDARRDGDAPSS